MIQPMGADREEETSRLLTELSTIMPQLHRTVPR